MAELVQDDLVGVQLGGSVLIQHDVVVFADQPQTACTSRQERAVNRQECDATPAQLLDGVDERGTVEGARYGQLSDELTHISLG
ncbi:Uncharacterised protein [Mycobacteroides abscessus subsp. massiliense]|nr:Uncharacterised protein [Mycobacteroides abscessus subsp. massiliense]